MPNKAANKSSLVGKGMEGKFIPNPNCPRFIPMANGTFIYRNPETGRNERITKEDADILGVLDDAKKLIG